MNIVYIYIYTIYMSTLSHSCGFAYQPRVLKTFPGPGYLRSREIDIYVYVYIYIYIYIYVYIYIRDYYLE